MRFQTESNLEKFEEIKTLPNVEVEEFVDVCLAKMYENGVTKESLIKEAIVDAIKHCNNFEIRKGNKIERLSLKLGMSNQYSKKGIIDIAAIVRVNVVNKPFKKLTTDDDMSFKNYTTITLSDGDSNIESMPIFDDSLRHEIIEKTKVVQKVFVRGFFCAGVVKK